MSGGFFRVTITDSDYHHTTYVTCVSASSRNQAIVQGAGLAGQEKMRREHERTCGRRDLVTEGFLAPEMKLEPCTLDEFYAWEDRVQVTTH